jgi:Ni/Co efflux regulator RcnB
MKRLVIAALAAVSFAAPLALAGTAAADPPRNERGRDRHDDRDGYRGDRRDEGRSQRWDDRRFNGYTSNGRWYYGPPPRNFRGDARYDYRGWRRGDRLSNYHRSHYAQVDWRRARLHAPPRGYRYVRDDRGETLLVGIATGVILSVILGN